MQQCEILDFYRAQSPLSDPGPHTNLLAGLPVDVDGVARVVQGLLIYEHVAAPFYGVGLTPARRQESHIRPIAGMLAAIRARDDRPLVAARVPAKRLTGICRHFALLLTSLLRHQGIPARCRVGFGGYFRDGMYEDHWVCEYWDAASQSWKLADPQFDAIWCQRFNLRHDPLDVPRDQFLTASAAWRTCRSGQLSGDRFGIVFARLRGLWFIAGSLGRDLAALNKQEVLAWDVWGAQPAAPMELTAAQLAFFDELAELIRLPDSSFTGLRQRYETDPQLRLPHQVFNALRQQMEFVQAA